MPSAGSDPVMRCRASGDAGTGSEPNGRDLGVPMWQRYVLLWVGREPAGPEGRKEKHP